MSNTATYWATRQYAGGAAAKCVLLLLADDLDQTGACRSTTRALALDACTDQKTLRAQLDRLRDVGLISWTASPSRGRGREYTLHLDRARRRGDDHARVVGLLPVPDPEPLVLAARVPSRDVPLALRQQVLDRDGNICQHCGTPDDLQMDHVIPWSRGGPTTLDNLQALCGPCNRRKSNTVGTEALCRTSA